MNGPSPTSDDHSHICPVCGKNVNLEPSTPGVDSPCDHCGHLQWFRIQELDDAVILNLLPGMDPERVHVQPVGRRLARLQSPPHIIVNLSLVEWISSTFANEMVRLLEIINAANGKLTLCGVQPFVREVFRVSVLESLFDFADDMKTALDDLS
jgi:anti-anti-sigma factor